ncbi:hypothetical protein GOBAR_DD29797 [Gossypium barbadense]|nr:hypothetical protein GOBAR_DD29797 [Gossypium barbadense]
MAENLANSTTREQVMLRVVYTLWYIWKAKCEKVMQGKEIDVWSTIRNILFATKEWSYMNAQYKLGRSQDMPDFKIRGWEKPEDSWLKINCDVTFNVDTGDTGLGVVVQNSEGLLVDGTGKHVQVDSLEVMKALALKMVADLAKQKGFQNIIFEIDLKVVMDEI